MFEEQKKRLLESLDIAHEAYYQDGIFGGPSLYFHVQSLDAARNRQCDRFIECTYAMLASWGMHRMGSGGSKMREFEDFQSSMHKVWPLAAGLQDKQPGKLTEDEWSQLRTMFCEIRCMATATSLVGNSKVLAHLLPNLVPPVDREYTLMFLFGKKQIVNDMDREWQNLRQVLQGFFHPVVQNPVFQEKAERWLAQQERFRWDTSALKIVDNLVIALKQPAKAQTAGQ